MSAEIQQKDDSSTVKTTDDLYVNEATLELIRRRIESEVRTNLWRTIGVPVGGGGTIAIILALFVWIPAKVGDVIETSDKVKNEIQTSVTNYLQDEKKGKKLITDQVPQHVINHLTSKEGITLISERVNKHLLADDTTKIFENEISKIAPKSIAVYFQNPEGKELITSQVPGHVIKHLTSKEGISLISERVNEHLLADDTTEIFKNEISRIAPKNIADYFQGLDGTKLITDQIPKNVIKHLASKEGVTLISNRVNEHLLTQESNELIKTELSKVAPKEVKLYFTKEAGKDLIQNIVTKQISDEKIENIIIKTVNGVLRDTTEAKTSEIRNNRNKLVTKYITIKLFKGTRFELDQFFGSNEAKLRLIRSRGLPVAITFTVGKSYDGQIIAEYIKQSERRINRFGTYILLQNSNSKFLALCGPTGLKNAGRPDDLDGFARFLRRADSESITSFRTQLNRYFPIVKTSSLNESSTLEQALRNDVWEDPNNMLQHVAVVNSNNQFIGTTTRHQVIMALLGRKKIDTYNVK
ncbi:hypothetical protein [Gimesia aquarii]|uniref:Uncharacterized protein n=1 Tax=Gimesia aquarii TaxID=2527964 RepID=A0A517VRE4_9PLAN|nr:hypothetical protein [Gimesia aquarii]QDT95567.1 hypothetical protein V144x_10120 [Gimesia aquarii]